MKLRVALEFTFDDEYLTMGVTKEQISDNVCKQMELADVYFTIERPSGSEENTDPIELSPDKIEIISSSIG